MADVVHRTTFEIRRSVNTPDFDPATWLIQPAGLATLVGSGSDASPQVPLRHWKIVTGDRLAEMTAGEKVTVETNPARLAATRLMKKALLRAQAVDYVQGRYDDSTQRSFLQLWTRAAGLSKTRLDSTFDWMKSVYAGLNTVFTQIDGAATVTGVLNASFDTNPFDLTDPRTKIEDVNT